LGGEAYGINGSGWVVGKAYSPTDGAPHAFLWKGPGQMIDLGAPTGCGTIALGVNDGCYVVGYVIDSGGRNYSVMWPPSGTMEYLGSFPGGENEGQARAINNNNEITGTARGIWDTGLNKFEVWHAFLYRNGQMLDLGTTSKNPLQSSNGSAINSRGQVAGYGNRAQQPWGPTEAFFCSGLSIPMEGAVLLLLD
jgi:probable HAF family extracellular repeat protein